MRLSEFVTETFDSVHRMTLDKNSGHDYIVSSVVDNKKVVFRATRTLSILDGKTPSWEIVFWIVDDKGDDRYDRTGTGNQLKIFSFVIQSLKDFIIDKDPEMIEFSASKADGNRVRLYSKLASKVNSSGYVQAGTVDGKHDKYFVFKKTK